MDRLIYTSMSGAKYLLERQATLANNLANAGTTGFRADTVGLRAVPAVSPQAGTRVFTVETTTGADFSQGPMTATGRTLDVAVQGQGWLAVQTSDGSEAYTRNGALQVGADGVLQLPNGLQVQGTGGPISIPADATSVLIAADGTVSVKAASSKTPTTVGQLKLVNPPISDLTKGTDGLFRTQSGAPADADASVKVADGTLEGSNVNVVEAMVGMIAASRQFEMQMKMLSTAEQNEQKASSVVGS
ncbi:MAG TPA: flagellar basal-body rod protein FlgF [Burkholderiaceae bacterium]|jgi:flagellar basal-body rod protein FlgF|nr:flagellar basal-body rod protein FlgF [Burkholderiaceae bacterium]